MQQVQGFSRLQTVPSGAATASRPKLWILSSWRDLVLYVGTPLLLIPAFALAQAMWGNVALTQAYLTLSEVLGHVDLLLNDGRVLETEQDGVSRFEAT